jgi:hypothetical protein
MLLRKCWHIARPPAPRPRPTSIKRHLARERHTWHSRHTTHNTQATTSAIYPPNDSKAHTLFNAIVHHCDRCVISHTPDLHAPFAAPPRTQISEWTLQPPPPCITLLCILWIVFAPLGAPLDAPGTSLRAQRSTVVRALRLGLRQRRAAGWSWAPPLQHGPSHRGA